MKPPRTNKPTEANQNHMHTHTHTHAHIHAHVDRYTSKSLVCIRAVYNVRSRIKVPLYVPNPQLASLKMRRRTQKMRTQVHRRWSQRRAHSAIPAEVAPTSSKMPQCWTSRTRRLCLPLGEWDWRFPVGRLRTGNHDEHCCYPHLLHLRLQRRLALVHLK